jgi:hypothetical protein
MAYIDKGIPVICNHRGKDPNVKWGWAVIVGYEDYGKTLLYITSELKEPEHITPDALFPDPDNLIPGQENSNGWIFIGEKRKEVELAELYRKRILTLPQLLTTKTEDYCFGAEAFRSWASDIENGKFDGMKIEEFDPWYMYTVYVCNLATNSSCCHGFLEKALQLNPDLTFIKEIHRLYDRMRKMWNEQNGEDLESIGGGFNITLETLQNKNRRSRIAAKLREFAEVVDKVVEVVNSGMK